ncbi:DUF4291 family protein [Deinococcus hopiensis]|uniref:DUF4291 family protein n=1 Tax=Deinococcus hopiensis TaxID=309885 RepID=UPI001BB0CF25|nr:DUF4291 family protein [Deinococcus hopiensis]
MHLRTSLFPQQTVRRPDEGRHILAQFGAESVVVHQVYRSATGHFAARYGRFGGKYSFARIRWIGPTSCG